RRHTRFSRDWSSDVCSSDLAPGATVPPACTGGTARRRTGSADLDAPRPLALGLRQADREDAVVEAGLDLVLLDAARQGQLVAEPTDGPLTATQHADPLLLLALAPHRQAPAGDLDVEVVPLDAGHLELDQVRVVGLLHVGHR